MKAPLNWLRDFVDIDVPAADLAERLTRAGLEVEGIKRLGRELDGVIVGEIVAVDAHPSADRLSVCRVRTGDETRKVVCGAPNTRVGTRVPLALPGTLLPTGRRIEATEVRGVVSEGMLCSEAELGLGTEAGGLCLLSADATPGQMLSAHLGMEDSVLEVAVPPNRGDCLSMLGLSREIAALYGLKVGRQRVRLREHGEPAASRITIRIDDPEGCSRYTARYISGIKVGPPPLWMQRRLLAVDLRPINNIVDVTNYVMFERGQPLHAFDYDQLPQRRIVVRRAKAGATFRTLDAHERTLAASDLLITTGDEPVAIAGVMGGASSEVTSETRDVLLESAWFDPSTVRRTSRRLALRSEASYRFERGVDLEGVVPALDRAAALIAKLGGGQIAPGVVEAHPRPRGAPVIDLRVPRIEFLLGLPLERRLAASTLRRLGASVKAKPKQSLQVVPPSWRHDLEREVDLIEEIIRLVGYDQVPTTLPTGDMQGGIRLPVGALEAGLRQFMAAQGFHEMVSLSFCSARNNQLFRGVGVPVAGAVQIRNPIVTEEPEMRFSLCPGLLQAVRTNVSLGESRVAGFAVGKVFWTARRPVEARRLAAVLSGSLPTAGLWQRELQAADFLDAKGALESVLERLGLLDRVQWQRAGEDQIALHPGKSAQALLDGAPIAIVGGLHPSVEAELGLTQACWVFELDIERALDYGPIYPIFQDLPRFPAVVRDVAILTDVEFASDQVIRFIRGWNTTVVGRVLLFDQYMGPPVPEGKKSLAYSIAYRAADRTLTDEEVTELHEKLLADMSALLPIELRR